MSKHSDSIDKVLEFIPSKFYIDNLEKELSVPFEKVSFFYFKIMAEDYFLRITKKLEEALERGSQVELQLDAIYSKRNIDGGNFYYPLTSKGKKINEEAIEKNLKLFSYLESKGAKISFFNEPGKFSQHIPFIKRDHRKVVIIQRNYGSIAYFGATNIAEADKNDFMIKIHDHRLAEEIGKISTLNFIKSQKEDYILEISKKLKFILDIGQNFRSKIQSTAYEMILKARKEVVFVSQIPVEFSLMFRFIAARINGAKVKIVLPAFNNQNVSGFPFIFFFIMNWIISKIFKMQLVHCAEEYSHAKILVCDNSVLLGSHNLSSAGIMFGTVEFSVYVEDENFIKPVKEFIQFLEGDIQETKVISQKDFIYNTKDNDER